MKTKNIPNWTMRARSGIHTKKEALRTVSSIASPWL